MVRGQVAISTEAALSLIRLMKQYEAEIFHSIEPKVRKTAWNVITHRLNTEYGLDLDYTVWKKKYQNIQHIVKKK